VCLWLVKSISKGNRHGKTAVAQDRAFSGLITPDGKGVVLGLDFGNKCGVFKVDNENLKLERISDLPVIDENKNLSSISLGFSCKARNTVKEAKSAWIVGLLIDPKNSNKQLVSVQNLNGTLIQGTPFDSGLGNINSIKASGQFFGVCGFASQLKIYKITDNFFKLENSFSISHSGQVYDFAFNGNEEWYLPNGKIATLTKNKIIVYEMSESGSKILKELDNPVDDVNKFKPILEFDWPFLAITHGADVVIMDAEKDCGAVQTYKNVYPQVIKDVKIMKKNRMVITAGGRFIKVLKF